jgi:hypothetical protein
MFNLNFDICLVPCHAILTEITAFKLKHPFLETPIISWKGPILEPIEQFDHFLAIFVSISGLVDEISCSGSKPLLKEISTRESSSNWLGQVYVRFTIWDRELREAIVIQHAAILNSKWSKILSISRALRCIRAGGHAFTDKYRRLFLTTSANVLAIKYNASQHKLLHVICINI